MSAWFLKKADGSVYGPVDDADLRDWATDGRVAPDDELSTDKQAWKSASAMAALEMVWNVQLEGAEVFGPLNILAICDLCDQGAIPPDAQLTNVKTGETVTASAPMLSALLAERKKLKASGGEREAAWKELLQKERQIAAGREGDLRHKLEKARQMQLALQEGFKRIEQGMKSGSPAVAPAAVPPVQAIPRGGGEERVTRLEKELGELKNELDIERKHLHDEREEWQRRTKRRDEEKARLEQEISELHRRLGALSGEVPGSPAAKAPGAEVASERPAEAGEGEPGGEGVSPVIKAAAAKLRAQVAANQKQAQSQARTPRNDRKGMSSSQMRRGPAR